MDSFDVKCCNISIYKDDIDQSDLSAMDHAAKDDLIRFLLAENAELKSRITALEVRLAKDSHNSSKPPSSDGLSKPAPNSLRQAGQRPKGGQKGHKGSALERVAEPDHVVNHPLPATCDACGSSLDEAHVSETRQVFDIYRLSRLKSLSIAFWKYTAPAAVYIGANFRKPSRLPRNMGVYTQTPENSVTLNLTCLDSELSIIRTDIWKVCLVSWGNCRAETPKKRPCQTSKIGKYRFLPEFCLLYL